jgi:hypothetical protein
MWVLESGGRISASPIQLANSTRLRSKSNFTLPNIWRLISVTRFMFPLHGPRAPVEGQSGFYSQPVAMQIAAEATHFRRTSGLNIGNPLIELGPGRSRTRTLNRCAKRRLMANSLLLRHSSVRRTRSASSNSERRRNSSQHKFCGPGSMRRTGGGALVLRQFSTNRLTVRLLPRYPSVWTSLHRYAATWRPSC